MRRLAVARDYPRNMFTVRRHGEFVRARILGRSGRQCRERHYPRWLANRWRDRDCARGRTLLDTLDWHSSARAPEAASLAIQCGSRIRSVAQRWEKAPVAGGRRVAVSDRTSVARADS